MHVKLEQIQVVEAFRSSTHGIEKLWRYRETWGNTRPYKSTSCQRKVQRLPQIFR